MRLIVDTIKKCIPIQSLKVFHKTAFSPKYLLVTNCCISISLSSVGDCLEQQYELYKKDIDVYSTKRTAHMALSGLTVGVVCHYWYKIIDKRMPGRSLSIVLKKVFWDQIICSPIVISTFFLTLGVLESANKEQIMREIREKALRLYLAEWTVWPPAQVFNFYCLPNKYRILYDNTISLGYDVYTSKVKHGKM